MTNEYFLSLVLALLLAGGVLEGAFLLSVYLLVRLWPQIKTATHAPKIEPVVLKAGQVVSQLSAHEPARPQPRKPKLIKRTFRFEDGHKEYRDYPDTDPMCWHPDRGQALHPHSKLVEVKDEEK